MGMGPPVDEDDEIGGGAILPGETAVLSGSGATWPWYNATGSPGRRNTTTGVYWFAWEALNPVLLRREIRVKTYDPATGIWTPEVVAGTTTLTDDDHGVPDICFDSNGFAYVFYGAHDTAMRIASTTEANNPFAWTEQTALTGAYTYPHATVIADVIYLFMQKESGSVTSDTLVLRTATAWGAGTASFSAEDAKIDLGPDARVYSGNHIPVGANIFFAVTRADAADASRQHVYYFVYETDTDDIRNFADDVTIDTADLPVDLTEANASFRVFTHSGANMTVIPTSCIDTDGEHHIVFADGSATALTVKHIRSGNAFASPSSIGSMTGRFDGLTIAPALAGVVEAWWAQDESGLWTRGGNIKRAVRSDAGVWGPATTMQTAGPTYPLDVPSMVLDGGPEARVIFGEIAQQSVTEAGNLKMYAHGDSGLLLNVPGAYTFVNAEAAAYHARRTVALSFDEKYHVDNLFSCLKEIGLAKFDAWYDFSLGTSRADCLLNLIGTSWNLTEAGTLTYAAGIGFTGNGTDGRLRTGATLSTFGGAYSLNSAHLGICNQLTSDNGNQQIGASDGTNLSFIIGSNGTSVVYRNNSTSTTSVANTNRNGHFVTSRTASNSSFVKRNSVTIGTTSSIASVALPAAELCILSVTAVAFSTQQIAYAHFGSALTTQEVVDLHFEGTLPLRRIRGLV